MTHFYVCLVGFRYGKSKEKTPIHWHAGITDKPHYKQRNSNYLDCIFWEDFNTRDEALAFEATVSDVVPYVFEDEIRAYWREPDPEEPDAEPDDGSGDLRILGDDTPLRIDAFRLASTYRVLLELWQERTLKPCGLAVLRSEKCRAFGRLNAQAREQLIEKVKALIPSSEAVPVTRAVNADMWEEG